MLFIPSTQSAAHYILTSSERYFSSWLHPVDLCGKLLVNPKCDQPHSSTLRDETCDGSEILQIWRPKARFSDAVHWMTHRQQCSSIGFILVLDLRDHTVWIQLRFKPPDDSLSRDEIAIVVALSHHWFQSESPLLVSCPVALSIGWLINNSARDRLTFLCLIFVIIRKPSIEIQTTWWFP